MFQTGLRISAVNRAADDASGAGAPESFCNSRRPYMSALHDCGCTALLSYVTSGALTYGLRSVVALPVPSPREAFVLFISLLARMPDLPSLLSEVRTNPTGNTTAQSIAGTTGGATLKFAWHIDDRASQLSLRLCHAGPCTVATVRLSEALPSLLSSCRTEGSQLVCLSGHGKYRLMTPVSMPECWPVADPDHLSLYQGPAPSLHHALGDLGLDAPPRLATSIPAVLSPMAVQRYSQSSQPHSGVPATLATGQGCYRFFFLNHSKPPPPPQGWPDSYQDDQHCTVCDRRESTTPLVKHLLLHTVCSGSRAHPQLSRGFAVALVNHRMWVYPRSACVIGTRPCRKDGRPFWHTTWPIQAVRNVGIPG